MIPEFSAHDFLVPEFFASIREIRGASLRHSGEFLPIRVIRAIRGLPLSASCLLVFIRAGTP
jgi:hypothetical protein